MGVVSVRLPPQLAERFDRVAASGGGRSHVLRRLVGRYLQEAGEGELVERIALQKRGRSEKLTLRLRSGELSLLEAVSLSEGFTRTGWVTALVRSRLFNRPALNPSDSEAYRLSVRELNRIGINLNQIARLMNQAAQEGVVLAPDVEVITEAREEIRKIAENLREGLRGNQASWG